MPSFDDAVEDEIIALESIYAELQVARPHATEIRLKLPVSLVLDRPVHLSSQSKPLDLSHLPPVLLEVILSSGYPFHAPPLIQLDCPWTLTSTWLASLTSRLSELWASDVVLFSIIDTLQHALEDEPGLLHIGPTSDRPSATFDADLIRFNAAQSSELFASQTYACSICLEPQKGRRCIQLGCHHVFCVACLHAYFSLSIHEGIVKSVACPNCSDERAKALKERPGLEGSDLPGHVDESVLGEIVGPELLARYQWLVDKQRWEADPSIAFCPRESCQAAVPADTNEAYAKLRTCPRCSFSFCVFCKRTWHGSHVPCKISHKESLVGRYLEAGEAERDLLHRQYGEATIRKLVETYLEDRANEEWKSAHTTPCPDCGVPVEKSVGCSHMTCAKCGRHFCFKCGLRLPASEPYKHFSDPKSGGSCYGRLFDYEPEQAEEANWNAIIGLVGEMD